MAAIEAMEEVVLKEEFVFVDEYFPIDLHEEEVIAETIEAQDVVNEQREDHEEIIHATNSILPAGYDPLDPNEWAQNEVIVESSDVPTFIKQEIIEEEETLETHVYECYKCARRFNFKDKLFKHMKLHHARGDDVMIERDGKRIWTCTQCDKTFISRKGSIIHQRTHTGERPYSCSVCQKRFIDSSTLMKHQVIHQATRPFTCVVCHRGFNQKVALQRHERTHSQLQPTFKCKYCPKTFLVSSSLQAHEKIHSGIKPYTCQYCASRFHTSTAQRQHERVHTNERPYACNYCPKAFKDSGTLFKHQVIHSGIRPFVCPICSQGFTQKVALRKHIRSHVSRHVGNNCEVCDNVYFNKDELCSHIEEHIEQHPSFTQVKSIASSSVRIKTRTSSPEPMESDVKETGDLSDLATLCDVAISTAGDLAHSYPCLHCGMSFRRKKSLDSHLSIHRTTCKYCDRPFPDKASLETHERRLCSESSPKPDPDKIPEPVNIVRESVRVVREQYQAGKNTKRFFYCERCDKTFSSRNGYIIHQRSHTGERPYPCRWCEKAFGDSATRHKHERIHTGERPFKCSRCPRAFNQRAALRAHQVTHTVDRAFLCKYCPSSFPYFATLKRHQQACHNEIACPLCSISTNDSKKLEGHIMAKHVTLDGGRISCMLCEADSFSDAEEFCSHIVQHGKQQANSAKTRPTVRRRQFLRKKSLSPEPMKEEEEPVEQVIEQTVITDDFQIVDGAHPCSVCPAVYHDKDQLRIHVQTDHL